MKEVGDILTEDATGERGLRVTAKRELTHTRMGSSGLGQAKG